MGRLRDAVAVAGVGEGGGRQAARHTDQPVQAIIAVAARAIRDGKDARSVRRVESMCPFQ